MNAISAILQLCPKCGAHLAMPIELLQTVDRWYLAKCPQLYCGWSGLARGPISADRLAKSLDHIDAL